MRESRPSIAKKLIFIGVIYKRIFISNIAQLNPLSTQSINGQSRSFDQKWELI
jgi:hypothetical protein